MEPHKQLPDGIEAFRPSIASGPVEYFKKAWEFANQYYGEEVARIGSVRFDDVTPEFFFREYIWVVHATGFSAKAVGKFIPRLLEAYGPWETLSGEFIGDVMVRVGKVCNNPQKAKAVLQTARLLKDRIYNGDGATKETRWSEFKSTITHPEMLAELPYIGKITCFHLGRNIGLLECVKPDLHLVRMAEHWGFSDCVAMCSAMRDAVDPSIPLGVVDLALWYAASTFGTIEIKKEGQR